MIFFHHFLYCGWVITTWPQANIECYPLCHIKLWELLIKNDKTRRSKDVDTFEEAAWVFFKEKKNWTAIRTVTDGFKTEEEGIREWKRTQVCLTHSAGPIQPTGIGRGISKKQMHWKCPVKKGRSGKVLSRPRYMLNLYIREWKRTQVCLTHGAGPIQATGTSVLRHQ